MNIQMPPESKTSLKPRFMEAHMCCRTHVWVLKDVVAPKCHLDSYVTDLVVQPQASHTTAHQLASFPMSS